MVLVEEQLQPALGDAPAPVDPSVPVVVTDVHHVHALSAVRFANVLGDAQHGAGRGLGNADRRHGRGGPPPAWLAATGVARVSFGGSLFHAPQQRWQAAQRELADQVP